MGFMSFLNITVIVGLFFSNGICYGEEKNPTALDSAVNEHCPMENEVDQTNRLKREAKRTPPQTQIQTPPQTPPQTQLQDPLQTQSQGQSQTLIKDQKNIQKSESTEIAKNISGFEYTQQKDLTLPILSENKKTVVVFLSSRCPCSNSHVQRLNELHKEFSEFSFVGVHSNRNETLEEGTKYFESSRFTFPVFRDSELHWAKQMGAVKTPHVYILDSQGTVLYRGGVSNSANELQSTKPFLKIALSQIREGKKPNPDSNRTLGCYIQR